MQYGCRFEAAFACRDHLNRLTSTRRSHLVALDLLRIISTIWIITSHSYNFALAWLDFDPKSLGKPDGHLMYQFISNSTFAVDNFFLLAGFLARWTQKDRPSDSAIGQPLKRIWNRFARLAPTMMLLILFSVLVLGNLDCSSNNNNWLKSTQMFEHWCRSNGAWLINLFMVHNIVRTERMCFSHSWYLAADFQLFIAFQLSSRLNKWTGSKRLSQLYATLVVLAQSLSSLLVYRFDLPPMPLLPTRSPSAMDQFYKMLYIKPYYWAASYFIGLFLAANFQRIKRIHVERARLFLCLNMALALSLIVSNIYFFRNRRPMGREYASVYALLARPIWSLNVACLLVVCRRFKLRAAAAKRALACFSRLSFAAYLLHPLLMAIFYGTRTERFHFSHYILLYFTIAHIVLTYVGASFLYILIELPCQRLLTIDGGGERKVVSPLTSLGQLPVGLGSRTPVSVNRPR